ncbi:MAG: hypothetical protein HZB43_08150 [candidate division Zixibacteria bacterium]|nr:hypothetical protein [candidate division Zixibacteria bacterium]
MKNSKLRQLAAMAVFALLMAILLFAPSGVSVAGDGGTGGPVPRDTTGNNSTPPDTTTTSGSVTTTSFWLIWLF